MYQNYVSKISNISNTLDTIKQSYTDKESRYISCCNSLAKIASSYESTNSILHKTESVYEMLQKCLSKGKKLKKSQEALTKIENSKLSNTDLEQISQSIAQSLTPKLYDIESIQKGLNAIQSLNSRLMSKNKELETITDKIKTSDEEFHALKIEAGFCPFCGTSFKNE